MVRRSVGLALAVFVPLTLTHPSAIPQTLASPVDATIWLTSPASQWDHAFPIGNGRLGAMVFGTVNRERIQLNEDTLWMGLSGPARQIHAAQSVGPASALPD